MKARLVTALLLLAVALAGPRGGMQAAPADAWRTRVDPQVLQAVAAGPAEFLVLLEEQADLSAAENLPGKQAKGRFVFEQLAAVAERSQQPLLEWLDDQGAEYRSFWIVNAVWVRGDLSLLQALAGRREVSRVLANPRVRLDSTGPAPGPQSEPSASTGPSAAAQAVLEWNIAQIQADKVWAEGVTGQGVVIGGQDTGYDWDHPALRESYRGWDGTSVDHDYHWHDAIHTDLPDTSPGNPCGFNLLEPCDDSGHGTHTMGIMAGQDPAGERLFGVAPGARWIGCRNMEQGWGRPSTYLECYQWFLAPTDLQNENPRPDLAPDVINNSWSCPPSEGCATPDILLQAAKNIRLAGIINVQSAGNGGPTCGSINTPSAMYAEAFTVGNTGPYDSISPSSSRGPVTVDGSGRLKPDVAAPGTGIYSTLPQGNYSLLSGTSMAGPHVAGVAALILSARPELKGQVETVEGLIERTAVHLTTQETCGGTAGQSPNNVYGWGRVDAWNAYQDYRLEVVQQASAQEVGAGEAVTFTLTVSHSALSIPATQVTLTEELPQGARLISADPQPTLTAGEQVAWDLGTLAPGETRTVQVTAQMPYTITGAVTNTVFAHSAEVRLVNAEPLTVQVQPRRALLFSPAGEQLKRPGEAFTYAHTLTNAGPNAEEVDLHLESSQGWASLLSPGTVTLEPGQSLELAISVQIPSEAEPGAVEITTLTAEARDDPSVQASVTHQTQVGQPTFIPLLFTPVGLQSSPVP